MAGGRSYGGRPVQVHRLRVEGLFKKRGLVVGVRKMVEPTSVRCQLSGVEGHARAVLSAFPRDADR
jgi:hypothetical protein